MLSMRNHNEQISYSVNGLHPHTAERTTKLMTLPTTSPAHRQKLMTGAAMSMSSFLPFSRGLCSSDGADIMHMLDTYPLDTPNSSRIDRYTVSDAMSGTAAGFVGSRCTLHARKSGM